MARKRFWTLVLVLSMVFSMGMVSGGTASAASLVSSNPADGAVGVPVDTDITLTFDGIPDAASFNEETVSINGAYDLVNDIVYEDVDQPYVITLDLNTLEYGRRYLVKLDGVTVGGEFFSTTIAFTTAGVKTDVYKWDFSDMTDGAVDDYVIDVDATTVEDYRLENGALVFEGNGTGTMFFNLRFGGFTPAEADHMKMVVRSSTELPQWFYYYSHESIIGDGVKGEMCSGAGSPEIIPAGEWTELNIDLTKSPGWSLSVIPAMGWLKPYFKDVTKLEIQSIVAYKGEEPATDPLVYYDFSSANPERPFNEYSNSWYQEGLGGAKIPNENVQQFDSTLSIPWDDIGKMTMRARRTGDDTTTNGAPIIIAYMSTSADGNTVEPGDPQMVFDIPVSEEFVECNLWPTSVLPPADEDYDVLREIRLQPSAHTDIVIESFTILPKTYMEVEGDYVMGDYDFIANMDEDNEADITDGTLPSEGSVSSVLSGFYNASDKTVNLSLAAALYQGDELVGVAVDTAEVGAGSSLAEPLSAVFDSIPAGGNYQIKSFLWDLNTLAPVADIKTLGAN